MRRALTLSGEVTPIAGVRRLSTGAACWQYPRNQSQSGADANGIVGRETINRLGLDWVPA
jgi:hypothetical protein